MIQILVAFTHLPPVDDRTLAPGAQARSKILGQGDMHKSTWTWQRDEVFVKINGERHYLWRAIDYEGAVLENLHKPFRKKERATLLLLSYALLSPC